MQAVYRSIALMLALTGTATRAQVDDYALPSFESPDAGVSSTSPTAPPLVNVGEAPPAAFPPAPSPRTTARRVTPTTQPPRWNIVTGTAAGVIAGLRDWYTGFELFGGVQLGTPEVTSTQPHARLVEGWVWSPGVIGLWARTSGTVVCGGTDFCGTRWSGGAAMRAGHASGEAAVDGTVSIRRLFFGELSAQLATVNLPPAPLVPGTSWLEGVFRFRIGTNVNLSSVRTNSWLVLHVSAFVELLTFHRSSSGVQIGAAFGASL